MKILEIFNQINPYVYKLHKPYIIAEAGVNHEGKMDLAKRLIFEAKEGGADAIKFQTYKAETIASKNSPYYWDITKEPTKSQYELFKKYDKFWKKEFIELKKTCDQAGIEFMSTPFDVESATFLNELMDVFKISSSDLTNKPFIQYMCSFSKPIILSTGAANLFEVEEAVSWIKPYNVPLSLLHCVLNYPTDDSNANLGMILGLKRKFPEYLIGYSDHTLPKEMKVLEIANLLGAVIIEKHFTFDKSLPGNDHYHAMDKNDLRMFINNIEELYKIIGEFEVTALKIEEKAIKNARRSLVAKNNIPEGKIISEQDLTFKRPAFGVSPKYISDIIGKRAIKNIKEDDIIKWSMIEE